MMLIDARACSATAIKFTFTSLYCKMRRQKCADYYFYHAPRDGTIRLRWLNAMISLVTIYRYRMFHYRYYLL